MNCPNCNGRGTISEWNESDRNTGPDTTLISGTCDRCGGDGIIDDDVATDGGTAKDSPIPMSKGFDCGNCGARYRAERIARVCCNGCGGVAS